MRFRDQAGRGETGSALVTDAAVSHGKAELRPEAGQAWWAIVVLATLYTINNIDRRLIFILVSPIERDLHLTDVQMSLLLGPAFGLVYLFSGIPWGWVADNFSRRFIVFGGTALWGLSTVFCGLAGGYGELLFARMALGFSEGALGPAAQSIISGIFPRAALSFPMSVYSLGVPIGGGIALFFGGAVLNFLVHDQVVHVPLFGALFGWQLVFVIAGLATILTGLLVFLIPEPRRIAHRSEEVANGIWRFLISRRAIFLPLGIGFAATIVNTVVVSTWAPTVMVRAYGWSSGKVGLILGVVETIAGVAGYLFAGRFVDWLFRRGTRDAHLRYAIWTQILALPLGVGGFIAPNGGLFCALIGGFVFLVFPCLGYGAALVQIISPPEFRSRMAGVFLLTITIFATTAGPTIVAAITQYVIGNPARIGWSLAIVILIFTPISIFSLGCGRAALRTQMNKS